MLLLIAVSYGAQISRVADIIGFRTNTISTNQNGSAVLSFVTNITANGDFYENKDGGHFQLRISLVQGSVVLYAQSDCLYAYESQDYFSSQIAQTPISYYVNDLPLGFTTKDYFDVSGSKYESGAGDHIVSFVLALTPTKNMQAANFTLSTTGCRKLRTGSSWSNAKRWQGGVVPTAADDVTLPVDSGVIIMDGNVTLKSLVVYDATIVGHKTQCSRTWTTSIDG
ncbi:hypothetical protein EON65_48350 [archaeon]|nr:MAG: hypothetical protein EON65_48350 [archaeon]